MYFRVFNSYIVSIAFLNTHFMRVMLLTTQIISLPVSFHLDFPNVLFSAEKLFSWQFYLLSEFLPKIWPWARTLALRLISRYTTYFALKISKTAENLVFILNKVYKSFANEIVYKCYKISITSYEFFLRRTTGIWTNNFLICYAFNLCAYYTREFEILAISYIFNSSSFMEF